MWREKNSDGRGEINIVIVESVCRVLKTMPYDPAIRPPGTYPENPTPPQRYLYALFAGALFAVAKGWDHTSCPPTDKWIMKICYAYILYICIFLFYKI